MAQMSILEVLKNTTRYTTTTTFLLLDELRQRLLALKIREQSFPTITQATATQESVPAEPLTNDFLANVLHALGGTLEEIAIDTLFGERLGAQLHLRNQQGLHMVNASLKDGLLLAQREQSRISVSEAVFARRAVYLADYGKTEAEQLAEIVRRAEQDPTSLHPPVQEALNLDFSHGLRSWHFIRGASYGSYELDPHTTLTNRNSLAITLHRPFTHGSSGVLHYSGPISEHYRGQRVRLSAYVKVEQMHQPELTFHLSWPTDKISTLTGRNANASCLTHSQIVTHAEESSWARHEMVITVPQQAQSFSFDVGTNEQGKFWLDGIELGVVDNSVALTGTLLRPPSPQALNLDFSEGLEYWEKESGSLRHYEIAVEATTPPCATLKSIKEAPIGSCLLQQTLISDDYQGKSVRLTALLKAHEVAMHGSFFMSSFPGLREDRVEEIITGTTTWLPFTLDWQVPVHSMGMIIFGVTLQGPGQIWLKDVHLQTVEE
jgi:bifunctional DNase/RNase